MSDFSLLEWVGIISLVFLMSLLVCFVCFIVVRINRETKHEQFDQAIASIINNLNSMDEDEPIRVVDMRDLLVQVRENYIFSLSNFRTKCEFYKEDLLAKAKKIDKL